MIDDIMSTTILRKYICLHKQTTPLRKILCCIKFEKEYRAL